MRPDEWLCAALAIGDAAKNFKVVKIKSDGSYGVVVRVLHKESGAVWSFRCMVDREGVA